MNNLPIGKVLALSNAHVPSSDPNFGEVRAVSLQAVR